MWPCLLAAVNAKLQKNAQRRALSMVRVGQNCKNPWCLCRKVSRNKNNLPQNFYFLPRNIFILPWNSEKVRHFPWRSAAYPPAGTAAALGRCRRLGRHGRISPIPGSRNGLPRRRMPPDCCMKTVSFCKKRGVICPKKHFCAKKIPNFVEKIYPPPEIFLTLQAEG